MQTRKIVFFLCLLLSLSAFAQEADLAVEKIGPSEVPDDSDVSYTVTVTNVGPDEAAFVNVSDPIPSGMSFVSATQDSGPTFTCDNSVNCSIDEFPAGATASFTFVFHIDEPGDYANIATVSSESFDPNDENDTSIAFTSTGGPAQGDMFIEKSGPPAAAADTDVTFTITVGNAGPDDAVDVLVTDNLPAGLTFVSFTQVSGPPMSCGVSTCTLASFPAGATVVLELTGHVPPGTPSGTEYQNIATVESENDPNDENNTGVFVTVVASADIRVDKSGPTTAVAGTIVEYEIAVTNDGPDVALNVVITDPQVCEYVNCFIGSLNPGQTVTRTANVTIPSNATSWSNTASVTTDSVDPDDSNNSDTVTTTITQDADLRISKDGPATVVAGDTITWTIELFNDGASDAQDVVVTDTLPAGTTFESSSCGSNPCNIATVTAGQTVVITIEATVDVNATGTLTNSVAVESSTPDSDPSDNSDTFNTDVTAAPADVAVVKSGPTAADVGSNVTYTIVVTNNGPGSANDVVMTDTLPAGSTFVSASPGCTGTGPVTCTIGTLVSGGTANLEITVTMPGAPTTVTNTAAVTTSSTDSDPGNNSSSVETAVALEPVDLSITKTADRENAVVGSELTYTIVVSNAGPGDAENVVVTDNLPAGTTLVSASPGCSGTTTITCNVGTLTAGSTANIEIVVTLPVTPGPVSNTASVDTSSNDPVGGNDASTEVVNVSLPAEAVPALSPWMLGVLALTLASVVLVVLRRAA